MAEINLRRLRRDELLEMLLEQTKEADRLRDKVEELQAKLDDREIKVNEAGTIAQASFALNGVLEAAEAAAKQYLDNLEEFTRRKQAACEQVEEEARASTRELVEEIERDLRIRQYKQQKLEDSCKNLREKTEEECKKMREEAEAYCSKLTQETEKACADLKRQTQQECAALRRRTDDELSDKTE